MSGRAESVGNSGSVEFPTDLWSKSRHGSWSGRGYRFQDAVGTWLGMACWTEVLPIEVIVPEGLEDFSVREAESWKHILVKSRWSHRGEFSPKAVAGWLLEAWTKKTPLVSSATEHILVLEQPVKGVPETGWQEVLADSPEAVKAIGKELDELAIEHQMDVERDDVMKSSRLVVIADPIEDALSLASHRLNSSPGACLPHILNLKTRMGDLADQNGVATADTPARISVAEIEHLMNQVSISVDSSLLDEAVRNGVCESVDFITPLYEDHFLEGVDVVPGHVVAGLPTERQALLEQTIVGLENRRFSLIVGPSGSGKSAAVWMSAHATRHEVRWYRIRRLKTDDVDSLILFLDGCRPSERAPLGFAVDDIGKLDPGAWDLFVNEALQRPGVRLIAAVRSEDLGLVSTIGKGEIVLPTLEESLAEKIHDELLLEGKTDWKHWREPFEKSDGLLLEYTHILTRGTRLSETIHSQIDQRLREERDLELQVVRLAACAHIWGGEASVRRIADRLDVEDEDLQRALQRLLDEHLLRKGFGDVVVGLHELRSREIVRWAHHIPPPTLDETAVATAAVVSETTLQPFLVNLYMSAEVEPGGVIEEVLSRLTRDLTADVLVAALQALRLVGFFSLANEWISILETEEVPPAKRLVTCNLSLLGKTDLDLFVEPIQQAVPRLIAAEADDPRRELIERLAPKFLRDLVGTMDDCHEVAALFAALSGTHIEEGLRGALQQPNISLDKCDVDDLGQVIANARSVSLELAKALVERMGGEESLLGSLRERAWVREIAVKLEAGEKVVSAKYRFVIPRVQPDPHDDVVSLCRNILHLLPEADVAAVTAVDATGEPAGFADFRIADKRIRRQHLPPIGEVAWNRARMRIVAARLASMGETERLVVERRMITETAVLIERAARSFCLLQAIPVPVIEEMRTLVAQSEELPPALLNPEIELSPLSQGAVDTNDPLTSLVSGIFGNMLPRLYETDEPQPFLVASFIRDTLLQNVAEVRTSARWRLIGGAPTQDLDSIEQTLWDLHDVVVERELGGNRGSEALLKVAKFRKQAPTRECGRLARSRIERRFASDLEKLDKDATRKGHNIRVARRRPAKKNFLWLPDEVAIFVDLESLMNWGQAAQDLNELFLGRLGDLRKVVLVPVRQKQVIPWLALSVHRGSPMGTEWAIDDWAAELPYEVLDGQATNLVEALFAKLDEATSIASGVVNGQLPEEELALLQESVQDCRTSYDALVELARDDSTNVISEFGAEIEQIMELADKELEKLQRNDVPEPLIVKAVQNHLRGQQDPLFDTLVGCRLIAAEWDLDPLNAAALLRDLDE